LWLNNTCTYDEPKSKTQTFRQWVFEAICFGGDMNVLKPGTPYIEIQFIGKIAVQFSLVKIVFFFEEGKK